MGATDSIVAAISDSYKIFLIKCAMAGPANESEGHVYIKHC